MRKILITKPNNNIYLNNREDQSKTDLQSSEILAFAKSILNIDRTENGYFYKNEIYLGNDMQACFENNTNFSSDRRNSGDFTKVNLFKSECIYSDSVVSVVEKYDENDILFVFCGIWNNTSKCKQLLKLVEEFRGRVYYILNDLRLDFTNEEVAKVFVKAKATVLTQARNFRHVFLDTIVLSLETLPFFYVDYDRDVSKIHDVIYPYLNFTDIGDYRKGRLKKLFELQGVSKLWVGDKDIHQQNMFGFDNQFYCTQKHNKLAEVTKTSKASFIVNEERYNKHELVPNRFFESLILGVMPLIDYDTANAIKDQFKHFGKDFDVDKYILNSDLSDLKDKVNDYELLYKTNELGQKLRFNSNEKNNILNNYKKEIRKILNNEY